MDVLEAIHTRRTIHAFAPEPVDPAVLDELLRAAHMAPCHKQTWPWRFTVVGPVARRALADVAVEVKARGGKLPDVQEAAIRAGMLDPGALVIVSRVLDPDPVRAREDYAAVACAVQNLLLAARARGLGTKWSTGAVTRAPRTYEIAGIDPSAEQIEGFVWVGRPSREPPEVRRPPVEVVVRTVP